MCRWVKPEGELLRKPEIALADRALDPSPLRSQDYS